MSKIKPQLIIYRPSRYLNIPETCTKKRLYLSKFKFSPASPSFSQVQKVSKARIYKYIRKTRGDLQDMLNIKKMPTLQFLSLKLNLSKLNLYCELFRQDQFLDEQKLIRRLFNRQKRLKKLELEIFNEHFNQKTLKAFFYARGLKNFNLIRRESTVEDLDIFKRFLQGIHRRKPWVSVESQKIHLKMESTEDRNKYLEQYSKKLLNLQKLINETCTELSFTFNMGDTSEVAQKTWVLFAKAMKGVKNVREFEFWGEICQEHQSLLEGIKDLKRLKKLNFEYSNDEFDYRLVPALSNSFEDLGNSLTHFGLKISSQADRECFLEELVGKLQRLTKLKGLSLELFLRGLLVNFFLKLSASLSLMSDLRDLTIILGLESSLDPKNPTTLTIKSVKSLLTAIESRAKLENLSFYVIHLGNKLNMRIELFCESLMKMKNLKTLEWDWSAFRMGNKEIEQFSMVLFELKQLEKISLVLNEKGGDRTFMLFFKAMAQLKWLQKINFRFELFEIKQEFVDQFAEVLMKLKFLKEVYLELISKRINCNGEEDLRKDIKKRLGIEKRISIQIEFM